jgi:hypothetical protein
MADSTPAWYPKYHRYRRAGKISETIGWLLVLAGMIAPSVANDWWIGLLLLAAGVGAIGFSWRLHRIAGMAQVEDLEERLNG